MKGKPDSSDSSLEISSKEEIMRYQTLVDSMFDGFIAVDEDGVITYANKRLLQMLERDESELVGRPLSDFLDKENADLVSDHVERRKTGTSSQYELEWEKSDGSILPTIISAAPLTDEDGTHKGSFALVTDITERRKMEEALNQSEENYRTLAENSLQGITVISGDRYIYVNPAFASWLGYTPDEILNMSPEDMWDLVHPEDKEMLLERAEKRNKGIVEEKAYKYRFVGKDGNIVWVRAYSTPIIFSGQESLMVLLIDITSQIRVEEALRTSQRKYSALFHLSNDGIIVHDMKGKIVEINKRAEEMFGYSRDELLSMNVHDLPVDIDSMDTDPFRVLAERGQYTFHIEFKKKNGNIFPAEVSATSIKIDEETIVQAEIRDISKRSVAETRLRQSQDMLRLIMNSIPQYVFWKDKESTYLGCNFNFALIAGVGSPDKIIGKTDFDLAWTKEQSRDLIESDKLVIETNKPLFREEKHIHHADGKQAWWEINRVPLHDDDGNVIGVLGTFQDITERKKADESIKKSEAKYRSLAEQSFQGLTILNKDGFSYVNRTFANLVGYSIDHLMEMDLKEIWHLIHPDDRQILKNRIEAAESGRPTQPRHEYRLIDSKGEIHWVEAYATPIDYFGKASIQTVLVDITDRLSAEKEIRTARDRAGLYLDLMCHDIRNQLQVILNSATLMHSATDAKVKDSFFDILQLSVQRCSRLIDEVKTTEDLIEVPLAKRSLEAALKGVLEAIETRVSNTEFIKSFSKKQATIMADEYLELLLSNIIVNAIEHNPNEDRKIWVSLKQRGNEYFLEIADNGQGIPDSRKEELFDMARRYGGIGLHQSVQIIEKYGGKIDVTDRIEGNASEGAKFILHFPIVENTQ
ncbi:MAG: PAS domain S-box protein [Candidatus Lokiarchaeota archaeon]|nr:PAS domain S-box protein [Candidatus Lokiarchaeota archaeon]